VIGVFSAVFSLISLFVKEKLYIGEASVAAIFGLIVGPHCLNWFAPTTWGNTDYITLEISRIVLCLQIFAVAVELPKKYMVKHWLSVTMLLVPVMTSGWLIVGAFVYLVIPGLNFPESLTVAACITATDPVLAAAVVGKGKFAKRVPGHLRNLLTAESGCNDGMAFPFIYLGINLVIHAGNAGEIVKDWICVTILYECIFGCVLGAVIGYVGRHCIKFAENKRIIDRESFLAFYIVLAFSCAGFGAMLGTDDLLVSFAAGTAFSWDGWFAKKTEESHVSTVIDLLINLSYFVYFGAIIPWPQFNNHDLGLDVWRLIILAIVVIFLRRVPAVLALKPFIPDVKTWREALFVGHFGPIGVGAVFAAILARGDLEGAHTLEATPLAQLPEKGSDNYQLISVIWPITTFLIITSILIHGSSVAVITLGRHLNTMNITMSFTKTNGNTNSSSWMSRLPELKSNGRSFSLHRVDTMAPSVASGNAGNHGDQLAQAPTIETSGIPAKPAGGMERRKKKKSKRHGKHKHHKLGLSKIGSHHTHDHDHDDNDEVDNEKLLREREAKAASFALGGVSRPSQSQQTQQNQGQFVNQGITPSNTFKQEQAPWPTYGDEESQLEQAQQQQQQQQYEEEEPEEPTGRPHEEPIEETTESESLHEKQESSGSSQGGGENYELGRRPSAAYTEGNKLIIEDQHGEILDSANMDVPDRVKSDGRRSSRKESKSSKYGPSMKKRSKSPASSVSSLTKKSSSLLQRVSSSQKDESKYTAYKLNNQLVIENEDGEIVRRYKINHHKTVEKRERSSSVAGGIGKALSAVGIKSGLGVTPQPTQVDDHLNLEPIQQPEPLDEADEESEDGSEEEEEEEGSSSEDDSEEEGEDMNSEEATVGQNPDLEETAVERERRLTALGQVAAPRDEEDEEEPTQPVPPLGQPGQQSSVPQQQDSSSKTTGHTSGSKNMVKAIGRGFKKHTPVAQDYAETRPSNSITFEEPKKRSS